MLRSPLVAVACVFVAFWGMVLLWHAAFRGEPDPLGVGAALHFLGDGVVRPPQRHRARLTLAGVGLMAVGALGVFLWGLQY